MLRPRSAPRPRTVPNAVERDGPGPGRGIRLWNTTSDGSFSRLPRRLAAPGAGGGREPEPKSVAVDHPVTNLIEAEGLTIASATDVGRRRTGNEDSHALWVSEDPAVRARQGMLLVV